MFFPLSKVTFFLVTPSNFLILCALLGVALTAVRWRRTGTALAAFGSIGLALGGLSPLPSLVILPLESRFPAFPAPAPGQDDGPVAGIVVLGGGVDTYLSQARGQIIGTDADEREIYLGDLARRFPKARLVFSGGSGSLRGGGVSEADVISRNADTLGVPRSRLILENRSRNTYENARFSADLVQPKPGERWILVTSAWHMPRAVGCFREAGFTVEAFPVDYRTGGWRDATRFGSLASSGLTRLDLGVKEWFGLLAYRLSGYIPELFPGPAPVASPAAEAEAGPSR